MKRLSLFVSMFILVVTASAQVPNVINWTFSAKKTADKTYEVHFTATLSPGWHVYSQTQPKDAVASPTTFKINNNALVKLDGKIKEVGKMQVYKDPTLGISANQYSDKVDFVQVVKLKANAKTNLTGNVEYQTCDDKKCLPPKKTTFNIPLN